MKPEQFQLLAMAIGPVATLIVVPGRAVSESPCGRAHQRFTAVHGSPFRGPDAIHRCALQLRRWEIHRHQGNAARISDLQRSMEVRFADLTRSTDARFSSVDGKFIDIKETLRAEMRAHQSELLAKFAELDTRLTRIENERRIVQ